MGPIGCPKTQAPNHLPTLHNIPEERRFTPRRKPKIKHKFNLSSILCAHLSVVYFTIRQYFRLHSRVVERRRNNEMGSIWKEPTVILPILYFGCLSGGSEENRRFLIITGFREKIRTRRLSNTKLECYRCTNILVMDLFTRLVVQLLINVNSSNCTSYFCCFRN